MHVWAAARQGPDAACTWLPLLLLAAPSTLYSRRLGVPALNLLPVILFWVAAVVSAADTSRGGAVGWSAR